MDGLDVGIMRAVMRSIFGTDARCREVERREADEVLARVEQKMATLQVALRERPARNVDEALQQISREQQ